MSIQKSLRAAESIVGNFSRRKHSDDEFPLPYPSSEHERKILQFFGENDDPTALEPGFKIIPSTFVCFTNRCGSNFMAEQLAGTGKMPLARERFNWMQVINFSKRWGAKSFQHFCQLSVMRESKFGLYATKIGWSQLYFLCRSKMIPDVFGTPRFIHVRRRDLLGQAISFVIARQTGAWSSKVRPEKTPQYDAGAIAAYLESIASANARFQVLFARFGFPNIEVVYEDFLEQDGRGVSELTEWLGLGPSTVDRRRAKLQVQRNSINDEWRARFLTEQQQSLASL